MLKVTYFIGMLLIVTGLIGFFGWEWVGASKQSPTSLAPAMIGSLLIICGLFCKVSRPIGMHAAVFIALLGFAGSFVPLVKRGFDLTDAAVKLSGIGAALCLVYLILGVKSFIDARRAKSAAS